MCKILNIKAILVGMLTFLALPSGQAQVGLPCEACPSGPTGTGVSPGIVVRRAIDNSIVGTTEVVLPCEELRIDTDVAYKLPSGGTTFAGFVGTSAELFVGATSLGSVAPLDMGTTRVGP